jgi:hypothetical protein
VLVPPVPPEKRRIPRERKRFQVNFSANGINGVGFTGNVSSTGMQLHSKFTTSPGGLLTGQISGPDGAKLNFKAEIRWVHKATGPLAQLVQGSMGLRFVVPPSETHLKTLVTPPSPGRGTRA